MEVKEELLDGLIKAAEKYNAVAFSVNIGEIMSEFEGAKK